MPSFEYVFTVSPPQPGAEILMAELAEAGFDGFQETETGLNAYNATHVGEEVLQALGVVQSDQFDVSWTINEIADQNWNARWEAGFEPIVVNDRCTVRASFHAAPANMEYDIVIDPQMSFGTGHHETTWLMLAEMLETDFTNAEVLDMGSGTAVLAILAAMRGATKVVAIDNEEWAFRNAKTNVENNGIANVSVHLGDAGLLAGQNFNFILANINLNVLTNDIGIYSESLKTGGQLFTSGFFTSDVTTLREAANGHGLEFVSVARRNNWALVRFTKS